MKRLWVLLAVVLASGVAGTAERRSAGKATCTTCPVPIEHASQSLGPVTAHGNNVCHVQTRNGHSTPDPACTPGAINPSLTLDVLTDPQFKTGCVRDCETSLAAKAQTYDSYGIAHPPHNTGPNQVCELDHLVSLELGGADTLDNIWPQCGPANAPLAQRDFKIKDRVENYLAAQVRDGAIDLATAQKGIASDWTRYLSEANTWCTQRGNAC